jgi:hypothetical protein
MPPAIWRRYSGCFPPGLRYNTSMRTQRGVYTMKNLRFTVFVAAVLALPLGAQDATLRASIPFEFNVRNASAQAGTYVVRLFAGPLEQLVAGSDSYSLLADSDAPNTGSHEAKLVFNRYGNQYFLSQISTGRQAVTCRSLAWNTSCRKPRGQCRQ